MILFLHAALFVVLSSASLACPVIWGGLYSWWSYSSMLPCMLCCPVSGAPLSYSSYTRLSTLGLVSTSIILLYMGSSFILTRESFLCICFGRLHHSCVHFLSTLVTPHIHLDILISFTSSRASCPFTACTRYLHHVVDFFKTFYLQHLSPARIDSEMEHISNRQRWNHTAIISLWRQWLHIIIAGRAVCPYRHAHARTHYTLILSKHRVGPTYRTEPLAQEYTYFFRLLRALE